MSRTMVLYMALVTAVAAYAQPSADAVHVPPVSEKSLSDTINPIPPAELAVMLAQPVPHHVFDIYAGQNAALALAAEHTQPLAVGAGFPTAMAAADLFSTPNVSSDGGAVQYLAAVTSTDAVALRLQVDLSQLAAEQSVYVIDPSGPRAYGPYTADDMIADGRWLPTVEGDTAVLLARTPEGAPPALRLVGVSHFYRTIEALKELDCNINAACMEDNAVGDVRAAIGIMVRTVIGGDTGLCSGTLINNPDTVENEPYYITANHCVPGAISAQQADIIWDFRTESCLDFVPPLLSSLPRSNVTALLETDASLDITLLELDNVPTGEYGRTYAGWDTSVPGIGDDVVGIHHPDGAYMRVSYGDVIAINQPGFGTLPYIKQTEVHWNEGVTEGGSSGSCLLYADNGRLMGTLSNGPRHSCTNTSGNKDRYASFRDFFPQIEEYLTGGTAGGPSIQLSETVHNFGSDHAPWVLEISNGDDASTLNFTLSNVPAWIQVSQTTGASTGPGDVQQITFTVVPENLAATFNTATIDITAPNADPRTVLVTAWGSKAIGCSGAAVPSRPLLSDIVLLTAALVAIASTRRRRV